MQSIKKLNDENKKIDSSIKSCNNSIIIQFTNNKLNMFLEYLKVKHHIIQ